MAKRTRRVDRSVVGKSERSRAVSRAGAVQEVGTGAPNRDRQRRTLLEVTQIPTASGREERVSAYVRAWAAARPDVRVRTDRAGNMVLTSTRLAAGSGRGGGRGAGRGGKGRGGPMLITAHLDHPAFVVERVLGPGTVEVSFRGGVMDAYFEGARIVIHPTRSAPRGGAGAEPVGATLARESKDSGPNPFGKVYLAELDGQEGAGSGWEVVGPGDVGVWALPASAIDEEGILHAPACDDLSAVAAALEAFDALRERPAARGAGRPETRLLFTRAEEIGFIGAIAACKLGTIPKGARVVALENSRAFADSPVGGGPIVRVGDRLSVFSPGLTAACAKRAEELSGRAAAPRATERSDRAAGAGMKWQRKLMAGGACEATVFCAYGHEATCLCLPLGNYHNMANLDRVQAGGHDAAREGPPRIAREFISVSDYFGLIDLLVALGEGLPEVDPIVPRLEGLYAGKSAVLREGEERATRPRGQGAKGQRGKGAKGQRGKGAKGQSGQGAKREV